MLLGPTLDLLNRHLWDSILCFNSSPGSSWDHPGSSNRGRATRSGPFCLYGWWLWILVPMTASAISEIRGQCAISMTQAKRHCVNFWRIPTFITTGFLSAWREFWLLCDLRVDQLQLWIPESSLGGFLNIQGRRIQEEERLNSFQSLVRRFCCCMMQSWRLFYTSIYKGGYPSYAKRYFYLLIYTFSQFF